MCAKNFALSVIRSWCNFVVCCGARSLRVSTFHIFECTFVREHAHPAHGSARRFCGQLARWHKRVSDAQRMCMHQRAGRMQSLKFTTLFYISCCARGEPALMIMRPSVAKWGNGFGRDGTLCRLFYRNTRRKGPSSLQADKFKLIIKSSLFLPLSLSV